MSNIIHSKPYRNWVRGALGLLYAQEGLYPFTDRIVKAEHARILQHLAPCTSCTVKNIVPAHHASGNPCIYNYRNKSKCNCRHGKKGTKTACNTCSQLYDEIITNHRFQDPLWVTDASTWYTDHWQFAKCFMTTTSQTSNNTAAETDTAGLLSIIINGVFFQSDVQCTIDPQHDIFSQVREIRNEILHNSTLELSDREVTRYLQAMIAVLEDQKTLINDPSAQEAVKKLKEIVKDKLVVTTKEEARAIQTALDAIKEAKEQCEESIRDMTAEKLRELNERKEKSEESLRELTQDGENLVKKTAEQCEESIRDVTEEKLNEFNETQHKSEDRIRELTDEGENIIKKATEQSAKSIDKLTEEKQSFIQKQALEAEQEIMNVEETAVAEVRSTVSSVLQEDYESEIKRLKVKHDDHEERIKSVEKKQSDLEIKHQNLEKQVSLLNNAQDKHQTRMDYLKQKLDIQKYLVNLYQKHYVKTWISPLMTQDNDVNISVVYVSPNMVVEKKDGKDRDKPEQFAGDEAGLTHMETGKVSEKSAHLKQLTQINRYQDIFRSRDEKNKRIYIIGDVGTGKSSFCKMMMHNWCRAITRKSESRESDTMDTENVGSDNDVNTRDISAFEFLLYVPLQFMSGESDDIVQMIKKQLQDYSILIDKIFSDESENCLILADGLDEWAPPQRSESRLPHDTYGLPTSRLVRSGTIITTSRPSARGILDMKSSECDLKINLLGVNELKTLIKKYMTLLGKASSPVNDLYQKLLTMNLGGLQKTPMLLQQITWMYCKEYAIDKSMTYIYAHIVNIMLKWMHKSSKGRFARNTCTPIGGLPLPKVFEEYSTCQENHDLIILLGRVAYDILIAEDSSSVVLDRYRFKRLGLTEDDISAVVQVGILHEVKCADRTYAESKLSFIHTSYLEFFAAVYISCYCLSQTKPSQSISINDLILRNTSVLELLRLENVLIMVCGLSPFLTERILESIHQVAYRDKQLMDFRREQKIPYYVNWGSIGNKHAERIQDTCFRCVSESNSTDEKRHVRVNLCDCIVYTLAQLKLCLSIVESIRFGTFSISYLSHEQCTSLSSYLSQAVSLESLDLGYVTCERAECDGHSIDLSLHQQLHSLQLYDCKNIFVSGVAPTTSLKSCKICYFSLSHEQCTSLASFLSQAVSLESLDLTDVTCEKVKCDGHSIDLSLHQQLQSLQLSSYWLSYRGHISVSGVAPTTSLKSCKIDTCWLSHEQCTSLLSFLSQAVSLESLDLTNVTCKQAECDGHSIDLSLHQQLQSLQLSYCNHISVSGVTPTSLKSCRIITRGISHEQCTSLSSFISQAVSLESLDLGYVTCEQAEYDGHSIDLSLHQQLQSLQLSYCDHISVSGITPPISLKSCRIITRGISHEQCTSLSSFLSQAVSLESLDLGYVTCEEAECNGHSIDLSLHQQLQSLQLSYCEKISVSGVAPTTSLKSCTICYLTLSHEQCTSLSSFLLQAVSLESLELTKVTCEQVECSGHRIDLSLHQQLQSLQLSYCDHISVSGVAPTTSLSSCRIITRGLPHEQCTSLSFFLSQADSLESLDLTNVSCAQAECDGHSIDLSFHQQLQSLQLSNCDKISISGVAPTISLKSCKICYFWLSHEQCISLSSFLSQAVLLESLDLTDVTCEKAECDGHSIDLSLHQHLQSLQLSNCDHISISGVAPTTSLKSCRIITRGISHEQCTSLSSFLSQAVSLESLHLTNVTCEEAECAGHSIDLSLHQQLQILQLYFCEKISVSGVTPTTSLKSCEICYLKLSHEQCTSLLSFISQAVSLESLELTKVTCEEAECDGHSIDLSLHQQLQSLQLSFCEKISVSGVAPTTSLKSCRIITRGISHEQCTSLSSFLSQAVSLESLHLTNVTCEEAECAGHSIDLSLHQQLQSLQLSNCEKISVSGVTPTTSLKSCEICYLTLSHEQCTSLLSFLSQAVSLESLELTKVTCEEAECDGHNIDLSFHQQLQSLQLSYWGKISVSGIAPTTSLKSCRIITPGISHEQCISLSSFLSQAVSLESLVLTDVTCEEAECDGHSIDLSLHQQLQSLQLSFCEKISVSGVAPTTSLKSCFICYFSLSHEECTSLLSFLSQAVSLESLHLTNVSCKQVECAGHTIDLSFHQQLQSLQLSYWEKISVSGVAPTTSLKSCRIITRRLSHEQCTSLSSFLSQAVSLESLDLTDVTCEEAECDGHSIDLSLHQQLRSLQLSNCEKISISGVTPTTSLKSCEICYLTLSHEQCTSLSSFLSQAVSLESLDLTDVTCEEAECAGHSIDLSLHQQLQSLQLSNCEKISVSGVTPTTSLKSCYIYFVRLSHEQCTSLSLFLSKAVSIDSLYLTDVTCEEAECDGHSIDLSLHQQLQSLQLYFCEKISVSGVTPTTSLKSCKICYLTLSHEQCTSLLSFLSQAVSLESLDLTDVSCKQVECAGHNIDLSFHQQLQSLQLSNCDHISVSGVTPTTSLKSCEICYLTLSHEQCTSLLSFLSQAVSLESLDLTDVTCEEAECDGHIIDLSLHQQLQSLKLSNCDHISISGVTPTTSLKSCEICYLTLSHEQCTSLLSFLSQAVSLESLGLKNVSCKQIECAGHTIDLSSHQQLQSLQLSYWERISVSGVAPITSLKSCEIITRRLSHEQCTSLSSFLSIAVSLESLHLTDVTCEEAECDGHSIDLSLHQQLQSTTSLKSCKICYLTLSHEQCTSLLSFLSQAVSLESLDLTNVSCEQVECAGHNIDLSFHQQLQSLQLSYWEKISVSGVAPTTSLKSCEIITRRLSHEQCTSLSSFLSQAVSLESLDLGYVTCEEAECAGHSIDLSLHQQLQSLQLSNCEKISVSGVAPTTSFKSCTIDACLFSHEQCTSFSSCLSQAVSLESLHLDNITCEEAECDGHSLDLSLHQQLQSLQLNYWEYMPVSAVTPPTTSLKSFRMHTPRISHEQCTSLLSFISQAVSLESLDLGNVTCEQAECDDHSIDLSLHQQLQSLQLSNCEQLSVSSVTPNNSLKSCRIITRGLSHKQCTSFLSFLSQAVSLESLDFTNVICEETECDGHTIDLCLHQQLQSLQLSNGEQISVSGVAPTISHKSCRINTRGISHEQCTSLSSFISQAISLKSLDLTNVTCEEAECDGHSIDLSLHQQLQSLQLSNCEKIFLSAVTPTTSLKSCRISTRGFSHEQCTSLLSFLSQAVSFESLHLENITCEEAECDGHSIDVSLHQQLQSLQLSNCEKISVSGVTPPTRLKSCRINTRGISHEQCTSLSSFLSQAVSLESLHLTNVTCEEAECDGHSIDLSLHQQLQSLQLSNCVQISVSGVASTTSLKSC